jgi:SAM-dependent methyltransferase
MDAPTPGAESAADTRYYDGNFPRMRDELYAAIRREAFGEDIGQFSWLTAEEHALFVSWLAVGDIHHVLEVASGSGGPALRMAELTGCAVTGVDLHADGVDRANATAAGRRLSERVRFLVADARAALPFDDATFDAAICLDSINHIYDRAHLFGEWLRVLRPGGRLVFTDPITVTGLLTREEMLSRSGSMGEFVFTPSGMEEALLAKAGFVDVRTRDVTATEAQVAFAWHDARARRATDLDALETPSGNATFQRFLHTVATLAAEGRLSRIAYRARRP